MITDARKRANKKWKDNNYAQLNISIPKETAEKITEICSLYNYTKAGFVKEAIQEKIERLGEGVQGENI